MGVSAVLEPFSSLLTDVCLEGSGNYLEQIRAVVAKHQGRVLSLNVTELDIMSLLEDPTEEVEHRFTIGSFEDTSYGDKAEILKEWQELYLPESTPMAVIGVIKEFHGGELVLMVCEDGRVFTYKQETLHLASNSLEDLSESGFQFPSDEQYYCGKRYDDMKAAERKEVEMPKKVAEIIERDRAKIKRMTDCFRAALNDIIKKQKSKEPSDNPTAIQSTEEAPNTNCRKKCKVNPATRDTKNKCTLV